MSIDRLTFHLTRSTGDELFDIVERPPLPTDPAFLSLQFRPKKVLPSGFVKTGAGLYLIHFDNRLIYIGKFLGSARSINSGDILTSRWDKHLGTLSMRGFRTTIKPKTLTEMLSNFPAHELSVAYSDPLSRAALTKDRGCVSSINRVLFAVENWSDFKRFDKQTLARFEFSYARFMKMPDSLVECRSVVTRLEEEMIRSLRPRCNREGNGQTLTSQDSDPMTLLRELLDSDYGTHEGAGE